MNNESKVVSYTYLKPINKKYIAKLAKQSGQAQSYCMDAIIEAVRLKKELKLPSHTPDYVKRAEKYKAKQAGI